MGLREQQGLVGVAIQFELWPLLVWADGDGHVVSLETGAMWGAAAREVVVFLWWGIRGGVNQEGRGKGWGKENALCDAGIHTGGGGGGGGGKSRGLSPLSNPPPLLNQHKYYKKVVLKQSDSCCSKKVCICSKTPSIFPKVYSSCQNIGKVQFEC